MRGKNDLSVTSPSQLLPPAKQSFSCLSRSSISHTSHFVSPLFSWSYKLLFPQPLCFYEHLRCPPGCTLRDLCAPSSVPGACPRPGRAVALFSSTLSLSGDCGLFV